MALDLTGLPDVSFTDTDTAKVESAIITLYEGITKSVLFPADPVRLFLSTLANIIAQQNILIDYTGKQNLLRYARGAFLDHLGALLGVERLEAKPASTVMRFILEAPLPFQLIIPAGTRVTADGVTYFATSGTLIIHAGTVCGDVEAACQRAGKEWNGIQCGQINRIVDPRPYVKSVENLDVTSGGADVEDDESLRLRINLKPESFSVAGPELAYVYWTLSAHPDILDASVTSPAPGVVNVFVLLRGGRIPEIDGSEIEAVENILIGNNKVRPFTDFVTIYPADAHEIDYTITWFISTSQSNRILEIENGIKAAVAEYEEWQTERIGRDIIPDKLISLCQGAGAKRVELNGLEFTQLDNSTITKFTENPQRIVFGGMENL